MNIPASEQTFEVYAKRLTDVLRHIDHHLGDELAPAQLAKIAHFSPFHFQRLFRGIIGEPLGDYIRRRRLDRAAHLLSASTLPIIAIAGQIGYGSQAAFTRAFRARFGISPARYRRTGGPDYWRSEPATVQFNEGGCISPPQSQKDMRAMLNITIETVDPRRIATIRPAERSGLRAAAAYGAAAGRLLGWAMSRGIELSELIVVDHGGCGATDLDHFDMAPSIPLPPEIEPEPWFNVLEVGGGPHAVALFSGKPQALGEAYDWIYGNWFPASGYQPGDKPGFYIDDIPEPTDEEIAAELAAERASRRGSFDVETPDHIDIRLCIPVRPV